MMKYKIITIGNYELNISRIILAIVCIVIWFMVGIYLSQILPILQIFYVMLTCALLMTLVRSFKMENQYESRIL